MTSLRRHIVAFFTVLPFAASLASAQFHGREQQDPGKPVGERPTVLQSVTIEQKLGAQLPLDLKFRDESGKDVELKDYFRGKPVVLTLVYLECPMLCTEVLNGLTRTMRALGEKEIGKDFDVVTISFDPRDKPELAAKKKASYLESLRKPGAAEHWHFLTGDQAAIDVATDAVGFRYVWDEKLGQFAHASAIFLLTPDGKVSRYFFGTAYAPLDVRLGMVDASGGKVGGLAEQILHFCYIYDPMRGTYRTQLTIVLIRIGGLITMLTLGFFIFVMLRREMRARRLGEVAPADIAG